MYADERGSLPRGWNGLKSDPEVRIRRFGGTTKRGKERKEASELRSMRLRFFLLLLFFRKGLSVILVETYMLRRT